MTAPTSAPWGAPTSPPGPGWPTELRPSDEPARLRSQVAVYVVCVVAMGIAAAAASAAELGVASALALAGGVAISLAMTERRPLGTLPGAVASAIAMMVVTVVLVFVGSLGGFVLVPIVGAFVLGLDWHLVRRLRPLPFASGFLVILGVAGGEPWAVAAGIVWLVLALGALASLEADRRAAQQRVRPVTAGPVAPDVPARDTLTTVLLALVIALVAALVLSTPSCRSPERGSGSGQIGQGGSGSGSSSGSGQTGPGSASGSGGTSSDHLYVPDPDGRFLIPNDGAGRGGDPTDGIPSPELLPRSGEPPTTSTYRDGTQTTAERLPDGTGRIRVTDPEGTTRTFTYRERSDGLIEIRELDEDGRTRRTLLYDPEGKLATDDQAAGGAAGADPPEEPEPEAGSSTGPNWRLVGLVAVVLAAVGALVWWLSRRRPKALPAAAPAPPWALRLAADIEREGAARGRRRGRSEPLLHYAEQLAVGPLPDARVAAVAEVVSTALFSRRDPGPDAQRWAEGTWAEAVAAQPRPTRGQRHRS